MYTLILISQCLFVLHYAYTAHLFNIFNIKPSKKLVPLIHDIVLNNYHIKLVFKSLETILIEFSYVDQGSKNNNIVKYFYLNTFFFF